jgi:hypothetical protein
MPNQVLPLAAKPVILASEGNDSHWITVTGEPKHSVRVQSCAGDQVTSFEFTRGSLDDPATLTIPPDFAHASARHHPSTTPPHQIGEDRGHLPVVHQTFFGHAQCRDPSRVRLDLVYAFGGKELEPY